MGKWFLKILALVLALAAINYPALFNGYPLFYSDSGTYIVAGFTKYIPVDRPYYYSWFVRHTCLWYSLWLVLLAQSILLFWVTRLALKYLLKPEHTFIPACLLLTGLGLVTGLAYNNSQVMADVFSPIALLCFCTLAAGRQIEAGDRFWLIMLLLFSISVHSSHLLIFSGLAVLLLLVRLAFRKKAFFKQRRKTHRKLIFWALASWLVISLFNYWLGIGFRPTRNGNIFLVARFIETGAAKVYLDAKCPDVPGDLCRHKDNLPASAVGFLWEMNSPLYDSTCMADGWTYCWNAKNHEYGNLTTAIISYGPSRNIVVSKSLSDSWKQLHSFDLGFLIPMAENSPVYGGIKDYFGREMGQYKNAVQYNETLYFATASIIQRWVVYIALLIIVIFIFITIKSKKYNGLIAFAVCVMLGCLINGVVCASFSGVVDRYMARMIWLIPMAATLLVWQWMVFQTKKTGKQR